MTVTADSIFKSFGGEKVLSAATITAAPGEIVALLGRMGTGKSTLLKVAAGVERADSGWVKMGSELLHRPTLARLARRGLFFIGDRGNLSTAWTVRQHFAFLRYRFGSRIPDGASEFLDRKVRELSGGEVRLVEFLLALSRQPRVLIADEPFLGLDPKFRESLSTTLRQLSASGCAIIISGHETSTLLDVATRIVWLRSRTTESFGTVSAALENAKFQHEYLGTVTS